MLKLYEAMYIVDPGQSEREVEAVAERLKAEIAEKGGEVVDVHHLGKKRLAYPIKKKREGYYFLLYFRLPPEGISELRGGYRLNESILRCLILKKKEREVRTAEQESGPSVAAETQGEEQWGEKE
jgi:small subunit ribosomal protein S6